MELAAAPRAAPLTVAARRGSPSLRARCETRRGGGAGSTARSSPPQPPPARKGLCHRPPGLGPLGNGGGGEVEQPDAATCGGERLCPAPRPHPDPASISPVPVVPRPQFALFLVIPSSPSAGALVGSASAAYSTQFPQPAWAEQSPDEWWERFGEATRAALADADVDPSSVAGVCVDTTNCTAVALDEGGEVRDGPGAASSGDPRRGRDRSLPGGDATASPASSAPPASSPLECFGGKGMCTR